MKYSDLTPQEKKLAFLFELAVSQEEEQRRQQHEVLGRKTEKFLFLWLRHPELHDEVLRLLGGEV